MMRRVKLPRRGSALDDFLFRHAVEPALQELRFGRSLINVLSLTFLVGFARAIEAVEHEAPEMNALRSVDDLPPGAVR